MRRSWSKAACSIALGLVATLVPLVPGAASTPVAHASPQNLFDPAQWTVVSQSVLSKYVDSGGFQFGVYSVAMTWQGKAATPLLVPSVGDVFYVHVWTEVYNTWSASFRMRVLMPAGLQLVAPTLQNDVFCAITNFNNQDVRNPGTGECAAPFMSGSYAMFPTVASGINERLHFWFPVTATQPMSNATIQVLSDQSNAPALSLPSPVLTNHAISVVAAPTVPGAPTGLVATAGNGSASIGFTPASNGGSTITNYQYSLNGGAFASLSPADTLSPVTIPGLANGTTYGVRLRAVNGIGAGAVSASVSVTPRTTPAAPAGLAATPGSGSATISFSPGSDGGAAITNHQYSLNGGATWTSLSPADGASPVTITGLANGTSYNVQLRAVNAAGAGAASAAVATNPRGVPSAPTGLVTTAGSGTASIAFTAGGNGGAAITNHQYTVNGGTTWTALSPADPTSPVTVPGLVNGTTYSVQLRAVNAAGTSASSATAQVKPVGVPAAPRSVVAKAGIGTATLSFLPGSNGGAAVTNYLYSVNGGVWTALSPADNASPLVIRGLVNGTLYGVRLRAVNAAGAGTASASVSVRPSAVVPSAPTRLIASPRNGAASILFKAGSNGGARITNYQYSVNNGIWKSLSPADNVSPIRIPGLVNGVLSTVRIRAVNVKGAGAPSVAASVRPSATVVVPAAPTALVATSVGGAATISFWPGSDGGSNLTNHFYSLNNGAWKALSPADAASPVTIRGLAAGTTYSVRLRAVNAKGAGTASVAVSVGIPATVPGAPTSVGLSSELVFNFFTGFFTTHANAVWSAPANGGSAITSYTVRWWSALTGGNVLLSCSTATTSCYSDAPMPIFVEYYVDVVATNAVGSGTPSARQLYQT